MMSSRAAALVVSLLLAGRALGAQEAGERPIPEGPRADTPEALQLPAPGGFRPEPPEGFRALRLGMELDLVKELLQEDALFAYRGDPDVSLLPQPQQTLIECAGTSYIRRAFFQFHERRLYIMTLALDPDRLDYFTLYSTLAGRYGEPDRLNPSAAIWEFEGLRLSLERPLSVKYIDPEVFARLQAQARAGQDLRELAKEQFLEQF